MDKEEPVHRRILRQLVNSKLPSRNSLHYAQQFGQLEQQNNNRHTGIWKRQGFLHSIWVKTMDSVGNIDDIYSTGMYHTGEYNYYISDPSIYRSMLHQ